jgi:hypothetical protein
VSFVVIAFLLLPVCAVYEALNAVSQMDNIEVYKQSNGFTTELEVRKNLRVMYWRDCLNGLDLHNQQVFRQQVDAVTEFQLNSAINDGKTDLRCRSHSGYR